MNKLCITFFILLGLLYSGNFVSASTSLGTIDTTYKYAWSDQIGWINFGCDNCSVSVSDTALSGYAWSENYGWIRLNPTQSGVANNGNGVLSGYAWGENTGWINFSGVTINSVGEFSGTATGDVVSTISFNCSECLIKTDWRPISKRLGGATSTSPGGGDGGGGGAPAYLSSAGYVFLINNGTAYTNNPVVALQFEVPAEITSVAISNSSDFSSAALQTFQTTKTWTLDREDGLKTVYVKFYNAVSQSTDILQKSINLDTTFPEIRIDNAKSEYNPGEEIILSGISEPNSQISFDLDDRYGQFFTDSHGAWLISLGKRELGKHTLVLTPKDAAGNTGKPAAFEFSVKAEAPLTPAALPKEGILQKIGEIIKPLIPPIFKPEEKKPEEVTKVTVPKLAQAVFAVKWNILPVNPITRFVLAPLPKEVTLLAQKFPQLKKTFQEVGVGKITDVEKIKAANLKLPGLTEALGLRQVEIRPGEFAPPKGIPIAELSAKIKQQIPSEIVFAKTGAGLVDYNIALSINNQGKTDQQITTIVGAPLELVVKPDKPVKKIKGYIIFKAKKRSPTSFQIPLDYLTASLAFSGPDFSQTQEKAVNTEEYLVLAEFEYTDPDNDGIYTANVRAPAVDGEYEIITVMDYEDTQLTPKEIRLITVVDPEGYIFEKSEDKETRIPGAIASLYWLNPETKQYELWPAKDFQQENPQTTDARGTYSFLVPEGYYYLTVDAPGYLSYDGKPFEVKEGSGIHINIELKTKYWWLRIIDWKNALLVVVVLMLLYNFYRDRMRDKIAAK